MSWVSSNTKLQTVAAPTPATGYIRPSYWPVLPALSEGDQKFVGLHAVWPSDSNFVALSATGAYIVDWGDGTTPENIASGVQANHIYDYSAVTSDVTSRGYKTVVVTVTPQSGDLTGLNLARKHTQTGVSNYSTGWLDIAISGEFSSTGLVISANSTISHRYLEVVSSLYGTSDVTTMANMFYNCCSLQSVPLFVTSAVTSMASMFYSCSSLQSVDISPISVSLSLSGCLLSKNAIINIFNNLATVAGQTITVSSNWGYTLLTTTDREIATNKGWTIA